MMNLSNSILQRKIGERKKFGTSYHEEDRPNLSIGAGTMAINASAHPAAPRRTIHGSISNSNSDQYYTGAGGGYLRFGSGAVLAGAIQNSSFNHAADAAE